MRKLGFLLVLMLGVVLVAGACGADSDGDNGDTDHDFIVGAFELVFEPDIINTSVGEEATILFLNQGSLEHTFTSESLGIDTGIISSGGSTTITFTPSEAGEFAFSCTVEGHALSGMVGTITVN